MIIITGVFLADLTSDYHIVKTNNAVVCQQCFTYNFQKYSAGKADKVCSEIPRMKELCVDMESFCLFQDRRCWRCLLHTQAFGYV